MVEGRSGAGAGRHAAFVLRTRRGRSLRPRLSHLHAAKIRAAKCLPSHVMGRLKPGWDLARASGYFDSLSPGLFESTAPTGYSAEDRQNLQVLQAGRVSSRSRRERAARQPTTSSLQLLLAITGLVLLIACANLANLMLARASARQREMAIRMALGASRRRMLRQLLIESGLLAIGGAALGVALAQPLSRLLVASLNTSQYSIHLAIATDWRVLLFAAVVAALTCIVFGTIPADARHQCRPHQLRSNPASAESPATANASPSSA